MTSTSKDLTIIYSTAHKIPDKFRENILEQLYKSAGNYPIFENHGTPEGSSINNYYRSLLAATKQITTPYLAICEDDALYPDDHFNYRPPMDVFAYNFTRWNLYTWSKPPFFCLWQRKIITTLICSREIFIQAFEERFNKYAEPPEKWMGEPGRSEHERALGVKEQKAEEFYTYNPIVVFTHEDGFGYMGGKKRAPIIRATALPYWGVAEKVKKLYE